jgi:hypothetical protein
MSDSDGYLEGGSLDGRIWDMSGYSLQAELTDENGRTVTYFETIRFAPSGLPIWTVDVD